MSERVRRAVAEDVPAVKALVDAAYGHYVARIGVRPAPMDNDHAAQIEAGHVFVVGTPAVGAVVLIPEPDHLYLDSVAIDPAHQGTGLGRLLLEYAEEHARALGRTEIRLLTNAMMWENQRIYPKLGYEFVERRIDHGRDRLFYRKPIPPPPGKSALWATSSVL